MEGRIRYLDKFAHVDRRIANIESWLSISHEERTRLAIYKAFQEVVEALLDILSMKLVDLRIPPKDDYTNIALLEERGILDKGNSNLLRSANGLRNRLVHNYNNLSGELAIESIKIILPKLIYVKKEISSWANK